VAKLPIEEFSVFHFQIDGADYRHGYFKEMDDSLLVGQNFSHGFIALFIDLNLLKSSEIWL
jgi:hypothetical protein